MKRKSAPLRWTQLLACAYALVLAYACHARWMPPLFLFVLLGTVALRVTLRKFSSRRVHVLLKIVLMAAFAALVIRTFHNLFGREAGSRRRRAHRDASHVHREQIEECAIGDAGFDGDRRCRADGTNRMGVGPEDVGRDEGVNGRVGCARSETPVLHRVETAPQRDCMLALGCDEWQGHYFSASVDAAGFEKALVETLRTPR